MFWWVTALLAWCEKIWLQGVVTQSYVSDIRDAIDELGRYVGGTRPYAQWTAIYNLVRDPTDGLANIRNLISNLNIDRIADKAEILAAIAALPAGSDIVIPAAGETAEGVWAYTAPGYPNMAWSRLESAGAAADALSYLIGLPLAEAPGFYISGAYNEYDATPSVVNLPLPDYADILPADTRLTWLQRTDTLNTWTQDVGESSPWAWANTQHNSNSYRLRPAFTEAQFDSWKGLAAGGGAAIWPGDALVLKGTPVELTESAIIEEPMDGILLTVDAVGPRVGNWAVLPFNSYYRAGYVLFLSAEGHAEAVQYIGPTDAVYCRQSMSLAASVVVKLNGASQVTVTPWTLL